MLLFFKKKYKKSKKSKFTTEPIVKRKKVEGPTCTKFGWRPSN
jgi:hypothetical protein